MSLYLPVIDLSATCGPDTSWFFRVGREIDAVCREHGFFYVVGHGVPQALTDTLFGASRSFFAQPDDVKLRSHFPGPGLRRGYESLGHQSLDPGMPSDLMEAFSISPAPVPGGRAIQGAPRRPPNAWPEEAVAPGLGSAADLYMNEMLLLSRHLMRLIASGLGLAHDYFDVFIGSPDPSLRLLHYPPQPIVEPGQFGCGAHTDWGALTLLSQDMIGGLQVCDVHGVWHDVPPIEGGFIVNLGDLMARWTNDAYRSTVHRVVNRTAGRHRYSIPYFFNIDYDGIVAALPGCHGPDNPPRYPAVTAGEHHQMKLRQARGTYP